LDVLALYYYYRV